MGIQKSAGLVIICNNKILLIHPTNAPWKGRHSIPKGNVEIGEKKIDAAIRETWEEIGLMFLKTIKRKKHKVTYKTKNGVAYKKVYYYIVHLDKEPELKKEMFQLDEVDWAGFFTKEEAEKVILPKQMKILKHLK